MENIEKIQQFVNRTDHVGTNLKIKDKILSLNSYVVKFKQELKVLENQFNTKQAELTAAANQLDGLYSLVIEIDESNKENL